MGVRATVTLRQGVMVLSEPNNRCEGYCNSKTGCGAAVSAK